MDEFIKGAERHWILVPRKERGATIDDMRKLRNKTHELVVILKEAGYEEVCLTITDIQSERIP